MPNASQSGATSATILVYGTGWCEDTRRTQRLLRRLAVPYRYRDVDEDIEALEQATALGEGVRRTPVVDLDGQILVEPSNDALVIALVGRKMLTKTDADERLHIQNVGDAERFLRVAAGLSLVAASRLAGGRGTAPLLRASLRLLGGGLLVSGAAGWCPVYQRARLSSLNGPGDRPDEAERASWLRHRANG